MRARASFGSPAAPLGAREPARRACAIGEPIAVALLGLPLALLALAPAARADEAAAEAAAIDEATRRAVKRVAPAVVEVEALGGLEEEFRAPESDEEAQAQGGVLTKKGFKQAFGPSTGLVVSDDGHILTTTFVLARDPRHLIVTFDDGRSAVARPLGRDVSRGLLLLKVEAKGLTPPRLAAEADLRVGRWAVAVGRGLGMGLSMSRGIISATGRVGGRALQSSAAISPANYGGPLVGLDGSVLGLLVPLSLRGGMASVDLYDSGIGFAIPAGDLPDLVARLKKGGTLEAGFAGIVPDPTSSDGVRVQEVAPGSPAAAGGLRPGDVVRSIDGQAVGTAAQLRRALARRWAGDEVTLEVTRGTETRAVKLTLAKPPVEAEEDAEGPPGARPPGAPPPGHGPGDDGHDGHEEDR